MTYQANRLLTLLNNYPEALKNTELAYNSAGNATEKFAIYQESAEAKVAKFKATLENLFIDTLNSSVIKTVIDFGTSIVELTNHIGILNIAVATLATKFASMALASTLGVQSLKGVALAVAGVNIPITILIASLGALVVGINAYQLAQEKANQETLKASDTYIDSKRKSDELIKSYEELASKTSLTQVEFDKLQKTKQDLLKMYPSLFDNLGKEADNYVNVTNKVRELDTAQRNQVLNQLQGMKAIADAKIAEYKASKKMVEEKGLTEVGKREASQFTAYDVEVAKLEKQQHEAYTKIQDIYKSSLDVIDFTPEKASSGNVSGIKTPSKEKSKTNKEDILDNFRQQITLIKELTSATSIYQSKADILEGDAKIKALDKVTNGYKLQQKAVSAYSTSIRQYISTHKLSAEDMEKLQDILRSNGEEWWNLEKSIKSVKDTQEDYNDKIAKDSIDLLEKQAKASKDLTESLRESIESMVKQQLKDEIDAREKLIKLAKEQLDLKLKEIDAEENLRDFSKDKLDKETKIAKLTSKINELKTASSQGDTKASNLMKVAEEERKKLQEELNEFIHDSGVENTKDRLKTEYDLYEDKVQKESDVFKDQLEDSAYIAKKVNQEVTNYLSGNATTLYQNLLDWNRKYGTGMDSDIISKWERAISLVSEYNKTLSSGQAFDFGEMSQSIDKPSIIAKMKANGAKWANASASERASLNAENQALASQIGYKFFAVDGRYYSDKYSNQELTEMGKAGRDKVKLYDNGGLKPLGEYGVLGKNVEEWVMKDRNIIDLSKLGVQQYMQSIQHIMPSGLGGSSPNISVVINGNVDDGNITRITNELKDVVQQVSKGQLDAFRQRGLKPATRIR